MVKISVKKARELAAKYGDDATMRLENHISKHGLSDDAVMGLREVLALCLGFVFIGALLPTGIDAILTVNTTGWGATEALLFGLIPLLGVAVVIAKLSGKIGSK